MHSPGRRVALVALIDGSVGSGSGNGRQLPPETHNGEPQRHPFLATLSHASQKERGSLYPLPNKRGDACRTTRPIAALLRAGFVEERETDQQGDVARTARDLSFGLYLTSVDAAAIGIEADGAENAETPIEPVTTSTSAASVRGTSKIAGVIEMLSREDGASITGLIEATGWLRHHAGGADWPA